MKTTLDDFKVNLSYGEKFKVLNTEIVINGEPVDSYTDIFNLLSGFGTTNSMEKEVGEYYVWNKTQGERLPRKDSFPPTSDFEPFTCSCGESGCAGIHDGIYQKIRKWTIEWRILQKDNSGYYFLDKSYYNFHRKSYESEVIKAWKWLHKNKHLPVQEDCWDDFTINDWLVNFKEYNPDTTRLLDNWSW